VTNLISSRYPQNSWSRRGDDDVVEDFDVHQGERLFDAVRDVFVGIGRLSNSAGVDVGENVSDLDREKIVDAAERDSAAVPPGFGARGGRFSGDGCRPSSGLCDRIELRA
jgi:hypothetical protein